MCAVYTYDHIPYWYLNGACPSFLAQPASDRDGPIRRICLNWRHWHWQHDATWLLTGSDHANCSSCGTLQPLHPRYSRAIRCFTGGIQLVIQLLKPPKLWRWRCTKFGIRKVHQGPQFVGLGGKCEQQSKRELSPSFRKDSVLENGWKLQKRWICLRDPSGIYVYKYNIYIEYTRPS